MTIFYWTLAVLIILFGIIRFVTFKMYALKLTPHAETPEKFDLDFEEISIKTKNNKTLYGWWIPAKTNATTRPTLILVHGWSRNLGRMLRYIQNLAPLNFNLLAFDARHHGSSDPDDHASMFKFGQDIQAAVKYACNREIDRSKIAVIGLSIGGAGAVFAAALEPCIKAVITVGAPAHPVDVMKREFKRFHIPGFLTWILLKQIESRIGASYEHFAPVNNIHKSEAKFLIIHGEDDDVVLPDQGQKLYEASQPRQAEYWSIPSRSHSNCHHEPEFWDRVNQFLVAQL